MYTGCPNGISTRKVASKDKKTYSRKVVQNDCPYFLCTSQLHMVFRKRLIHIQRNFS